MQRRKLEELSLMDDFLFNAMLTHPETGEKFTNKILMHTATFRGHQGRVLRPDRAILSGQS